jgi:hypothetical protein
MPTVVDNANTIIDGKINTPKEDHCQSKQRKTYPVEVQQLEV